MNNQPKQQAQIIINCDDLTAELIFFEAHGFKLIQVLPADDPQMMLVEAFGLQLKLVKSKATGDTEISIPATMSDSNFPVYSPAGVKLVLQESIACEYLLPEQIMFTVEQFKAYDSWVEGRAGMLYRDLIPDRLAGAMIVSNILIPEGGPVADHVHFHNIQFQLIFCVKGWVKVVYEDQGDTITMNAGDCVTQPPGIRHQVLEASDGLEVVEIGLPAVHMTTLDYQLFLPTEKYLPERQFDGQTFCYHQQSKAHWQPWLHSELYKCETAVAKHAHGLAAVQVIKAKASCKEAVVLHHKESLRFYYLMQGGVELTDDQGCTQRLRTRDCWVLPPDVQVELNHFSSDFKCIEFTLFKPKFPA